MSEEIEREQIEVVWGKGIDFAEIAEVCGVPTDHVVGALVHRGRAFVLYNDDLDAESPELYTVWVTRDNDSVMRRDSVPKLHEGLYLQGKVTLERLLEEEFGDDPS